jgi:hypothetical protein
MSFKESAVSHNTYVSSRIPTYQKSWGARSTQGEAVTLRGLYPSGLGTNVGCEVTGLGNAHPHPQLAGHRATFVTNLVPQASELSLHLLRWDGKFTPHEVSRLWPVRV